MHKPRVSVGMPVYNGEKFLGDAIQSIRQQTFEDLEIVISDNASTDRTAELCADFAAMDPRIRYVTNAQNIGAGFNHTRVADLARGEFFKWQSRDDLCDPTFLARCVEVLDGDPSVEVCHSYTRLIDEEGNFLSDYERKLPTAGDRADLRFRELIWRDHKCYQIYGLMRLNTLRRVGGMPCCVGGDAILLARLGLAGRIYEIPEILFYNRQHAAQSGRTLPVHFGTQRRRLFPNTIGNLPPLDWWDPSKKGKVAFPEATMFRHYLNAVLQERPGFQATVLSLLWLGPWLVKHAPRFVDDFKIAADLILAPLLNYGDRANLSREGGQTG